MSRAREVYVMYSDYGFKIGMSASPIGRKKYFSLTLPFKVDILFSYLVAEASKIEKILHEAYEHKSIRGEWFNLDKYDLFEIKTYLKLNNEFLSTN